MEVLGGMRPNRPEAKPGRRGDLAERASGVGAYFLVRAAARVRIGSLIKRIVEDVAALVLRRASPAALAGIGVPLVSGFVVFRG